MADISYLLTKMFYWLIYNWIILYFDCFIDWLIGLFWLFYLSLFYWLFYIDCFINSCFIDYFIDCFINWILAVIIEYCVFEVIIYIGQDDPNVTGQAFFKSPCIHEKVIKFKQKNMKSIF